MRGRANLCWALVASLLVHAGLGWALARWPCAAPAEAARPTYVCYGPAADAATKLLPGDSDEPCELGPALPSGPANVVPVALAPGGSGLGGALAGAGASSQPGGGAGGPTTTFFGVPASSPSVVYLLDCSGTMGLNGALKAARRELLVSLRQLPTTAHFQVIVYSSYPRVLAGRDGDLLPATADNVERVATALENQEPGGGTKHGPALRAALLLRPGVLYFLTDADDLSENDRVSAMTANVGHSIIHAVELTTVNRGKTDMPMQKLARDTGGTYRAVGPTQLAQ